MSRAIYKTVIGIPNLVMNLLHVNDNILSTSKPRNC